MVRALLKAFSYQIAFLVASTNGAHGLYCRDIHAELTPTPTPAPPLHIQWNAGLVVSHNEKLAVLRSLLKLGDEIDSRDIDELIAKHAPPFLDSLLGLFAVARNDPQFWAEIGALITTPSSVLPALSEAVPMSESERSQILSLAKVGDQYKYKSLDDIQQIEPLFARISTTFRDRLTTDEILMLTYHLRDFKTNENEISLTTELSDPKLPMARILANSSSKPLGDAYKVRVDRILLDKMAGLQKNIQLTDWHKASMEVLKKWRPDQFEGLRGYKKILETARLIYDDRVQSALRVADDLKPKFRERFYFLLWITNEIPTILYLVYNFEQQPEERNRFARDRQEFISFLREWITALVNELPIETRSKDHQTQLVFNIVEYLFFGANPEDEAILSRAALKSAMNLILPLKNQAGELKGHYARVRQERVKLKVSPIPMLAPSLENQTKSEKSSRETTIDTTTPAIPETGDAISAGTTALPPSVAGSISSNAPAANSRSYKTIPFESDLRRWGHCSACRGDDPTRPPATPQSPSEIVADVDYLLYFDSDIIRDVQRIRFDPAVVEILRRTKPLIPEREFVKFISALSKGPVGDNGIKMLQPEDIPAYKIPKNDFDSHVYEIRPGNSDWRLIITRVGPSKWRVLSVQKKGRKTNI